ncbi:MAG TPA: lipoyl(octanoyl) transferase [Flavobacteriaceae bacterium]|nr:MAG: Octanoyltransferase [Flavobacteriaceae bacterium]HCQ24215.1 lipoyl(octanoyl) transferase [Flavobacteriaceae bacterium]
MKTNKTIHVQELGQQPYKTCWDYQEKLFQGIIDLKRANRNNDSIQATPNYLLFVEHPPVFTLGKSGKIEHLLLTEQQLTEKKIAFYKSNRGGDITYHGPGQIVGYPILDLDHFFTDIHRYLRTLEEVIIATLSDYGLQATRSDGETGVWLDADTPNARKICAMGVRASRWVTMHGFALNVNTNLAHFDYIVPCGIQGKGVTSLEKEVGRVIPLNEVQEKILHHFLQFFEAELAIDLINQ